MQNNNSKFKDKIILLDTHAILHRFYHALPRLENQKGVPTQAVYGLTNLLIRVIEQYKPIQIFACLDRPEPTYRHSLYKEYKGTRPQKTEDFKEQIVLAKKILEKFNVPFFEKAGYEAEDLIGSIIEKIKDKTSAQIIVLTGDLDTLQLVDDDNVVVCLLKKGFSETDTYDEKKVFERFEFSPELLPDYKALTGDQSDNIKGIPGIGEKRGIALVKRFGTIENIVKNLDFLEEERIKNNILENKEILLLNKNLATINKNLIVELTEEDYTGIDKEKILPLLKELNFRSIIQRIEKMQDISYKSANFNNNEEISEINFETNISGFEKSLFAGLKYLIFLIYDKNIYFKSDKYYKLEFNFEILEKILNSQSEKITFDLKESLKIIFNKDPFYKFDSDKIFDLKLIFPLIHSNSPYINLSKLTGFYTGKIYKNNEAIFDFLKLGEEMLLILYKSINEMRLIEIYELEKSLTPVLARMELSGILFDTKEIEIFKKFLSLKLKKLHDEIINLAGADFNINSPKALREILFEKLKISVKGISKTPKGEISTSESELLKIKGAHLIVDNILKYRELNKILTTYTDSLTNSVDKKTLRIHTHFEQIGTTTGRIISQNPNLQNIPVKGDLAGELRKCFKAEDDFSFVDLDYSQIELRLAAHLSGDENLSTAFLGNIDVHSLTARLLFKKDDEKSRRFAKMINFGIIYGISAQGLKERLGISREEAQKIIDDYFAKFPGLKKMRPDFIERAKTLGYTETLFGRKRIIPEINSGSFREKTAAERAAINTPIQGLNADILKKALIEIDKFLIEKKFYPDKARLILQIYDSIILEVKDNIISEVESEVKKIMENAIKLSIPIQVKTKTGKNLNEI